MTHLTRRNVLRTAGAVGAQVYWMALCVKRVRHYNI